MIRAIALDDEPPALRVLSHFCQQVDFVDLQKTFTRTDEAQRYLDEVGTDLLFLDINMPFISGVDFYRATKGRATTGNGTPVEPPMVIFTTAYAEYAVEGFTLNAVDYLLKPFTFERFLQAVTKAQDYFRWQQRHNSQPASPASAGALPADATDEASIYVRADYTLYKIKLADILYIEGLDDYLKIHLQPGAPAPGSTTGNRSGHDRPIVARMTMKAMLEKLPGGDSPDSPFIRVHRSFIVPFSRIEAVRNKTIRIAGRDIPVGASYESNLNSRFRT